MCSEPYQLQKCLDNQELVNLLIGMTHSEPYEIAKECVICFTNSTFRGTYAQMCFLIQNGVLNILLETLTKSISDLFLVEEVLQAIGSFLNIGSVNLINGRNLFKEKLEQLGILNILDNLQMSDNKNVQKACQAIMDKYFEDSIVFNLVPSNNNN